jgi:tetratricopeptide (TPR) repeat protein
MLILKIRKAEVALKDGRLDEAFEQLRQPGVRDHYRGQQLVSSLIPAYIKRGQQHLSEGNAAGAIADYDRAGQLGGNQTEVAALRAAATNALKVEAEKNRLQQDQLRHARDLLAVGANTMCQAVCSSLPKDAAELLKADMARSQQSIEAVLTILREAMAAGNLELAIDRCCSLTHEQLKHRQIQDFHAELLEALVERVRRLVVEGRLEQARGLLNSAARMSQSNAELQELNSMLCQFFNSVGDIWSLDASQLLRRLKSLRQFVGKSGWLDTAISDAERMVASLEQLRSGPLSQLESVASGLTMAPSSAVGHTRQQSALNGPKANLVSKPPVAQPFQLNIDEAGCFVVLSQQSVTMGKGSKHRPVDIAFASQLDLPVIQIVRTEDDYFLYADQAVQINDKMYKEKLMLDGDRVTAAGRVSFRFHKSHAASNTAVIELSTSTRMAAGTARRIVLMDEAVIVGSSSDSHIVVPEADGQVILRNRNGQLEMYAQSNSGRSPHLGLGNILHVGKPVTLNSIRAVMLPANVG